MPTLIQPTAQIESAHASTIQKMTSDKIFKGHRRSMHLLEAREASSPTALIVGCKIVTWYNILILLHSIHRTMFDVKIVVDG